MPNISEINGYLINADTASYAVTASFLSGSVTSASYATTASYSNTLGANLKNTGFTLALQASDGTQLSSLSSLNITSVTASIFSGSSFTGSLLGTASWASNAITASYVTGSIFTSANPAATATRAGSASFAETASFVNPLVQNVIITGSITTGVANSVNGTVTINRSGGNVGLIIRGSDGNIVGAGNAPVYEPYNYADASHNFNIGHGSAGNYNWFVGTNATLNLNTQLMRLTRGGNLLIGTTTDSGFKLDVSGSVRFTNGLTVTGSQFIFVSASSVEFRATGTGVSLGNIITDIHTVTGSLNVSGSITGSLFGTASWATNALTASFLLGSVTSASFASTASFVNTLNQNVIITGSLTVGSSSLGSTENTLVVGLPPAGGVGEGGQILLQASGGLYTSASMLDNYQNKFRVLRGTNVSSDAFRFQVDMQTGQVQIPTYNSTSAFTGSVVAGLGVDSNGNILTSTKTGKYGTAISGSTIGTGVTAQTIVYSQLIPANTFAAGNIFRTYFRFRKLATNGNATYNILVNTSNAVAGATTLATLTANTVHNHMKRDFYIAQGGATTSVGSGVSLNTDDTSNTQTISTITWSSDQYIIYTVTLNTLDSGYGLGYTIEQVL